jgi:hypothetical protein
MGRRSPIRFWVLGSTLGLLAGALVGACALAGPDDTPATSGGGSTSSITSERSSASSGGGATGVGAMGGGGAIGGGGASGGGRPSTSGSSTSQSSSTAASSSAMASSSASTGPTRSCNDEYGLAPGYVFCAETATYCDFNLTTGQGATSCGATCTQYGGACIIEMDNLGDCDLNSPDTFPCTDSHFGTTLCRCTHF